MADLVPAPAGGAQLPAAPSLFAPFTDPAGGPVLTRLSAFTTQPAVRKVLPVFVGLAAIGAALLTWSAMAPDPQRVLYAQLGDSERASVAAALDQAAIDYRIDNSTGALTVAEGDFYRARMLVASDGALAVPESGAQMLDSLPMGASRTLEGERLRAAREADLQMTIREIDGVEGVRVHLAAGEKSVFVRDNVPPSASVMVRLARGRSLTDGQVSAVVNLVAGSVPGLSPDAVRVIDQHGRLLSQLGQGVDSDRLDLQARMEAKLREQVAQLLSPMLGEGNFTSEIQVDLNMDEVTSARESYDKDGVVRSETQQQSQSSTGGAAVGVPGVLANTPPPQTQAQPGAPQGTPGQAQGAQTPPPTNGESSSSRTYELGREVSVSNTGPGRVQRLSVAVAISAEAMKGANQQQIADLEALVSAAVGANPQRGDVVKVITRAFEVAPETALPFYETSWFAMLVRNGAAVIAVLLVLLLGVRPMVKAVRSDKVKGAKGKKGKKAKGAAEDEDEPAALEAPAIPAERPVIPGTEEEEEYVPRAELLNRQITLARGLVAENPGGAVQALRQMLNHMPTEDEAKAA
ncbi:MAG: flagellar basal-body MS-ring/collar protein FliF [Pseudomonadota bacterium]|uniref:flagellar basal-body MS-ring/collar protein FliF n=1 Tax=Novosphingobium sp. MBES04 TaxID=1206458 RepID=UPI00057F058C|nr:flagellar basal-body MS-ring/collar protein FliF [Novosphingobium sp. MBES04]MED5544385.1 flagellar basal-body MS-ring/collar protein FliF [Pseudomonadota bacterium]GAM03406.1 flagellar M-ring protein FliF [Novosphingobium sp. MBES04]